MLPEQAAAKTLTSADREQVLKTLRELYHKARYTLSRSDFTFDEARSLSQYVTDARMLLTELAQLEFRIRREDGGGESIVELRELYWELEGMVKEARNTLSRTSDAR